MSKELALVLSNKVNVSDQYTQIVEACGTQSQIYQYGPDGTAPFTGSLQWQSITPIGSLSSVLLSKSIKIRYELVVQSTNRAAQPARQVNHTFPTNDYYDSNNQAMTTTADAAQTAVLKGVNSGLRAFPLQSVCNTIQLSINNSSTSWNARQTLDGLQRLLDKKSLMSRTGECPCRPDDSFTNYPDKVANAAGTATEVGPVDQPLNISARSQLGYTRNALTAKTYDPATFTWTFDITEDLVIPGITSLFDNEQMYGNINTLGLILNWSSLQDMVSAGAVWEQAGGAQLAYNDTLNISITKPYLVLEYVQTDPQLSGPIPRQITYPYENVQFFTKAQSDLNLTGVAYAVQQAQSDTIRLNSMPKLIGFYLRPQMNNRNPYFADACLALSPDAGCVSINLGARSGLLANASRDEIWRLSVQAGSNQTRDSFCFGAGSFTWLNPIIAFGISSQNELYPGETGSLNLQISANYVTNNVMANMQGPVAAARFGTTADDEVPSELVICVIYEGQLVISPEMALYNLGVLSASEVDMLMKAGSSVSKEAIKKEINGAGLYSDKSVLHKGGKKRGGILTMA